MKKIIQLITLTFIVNVLYSQEKDSSNSRYISVTGSAEVVVQPDEIELQITLGEYNKSNKEKHSLSKIESNFMEVLKKNNINEEDIYFDQSNYYWYYWWRSRKRDFLEKTFKIKLDSEANFLKLMKDLDFEGVRTLRISDTSNKELQKLRKEVKIQAVQAAKEKARYLLESIDENIGKALSIEEVPQNQNRYWRGNQNLLSNAVIETNSKEGEMDNVASIKLRYEVKAKFEIK